MPLDLLDVTAVSWIVNKQDPNKYAPDKMIDGLEETSYQFSTKATKPGKQVLTFRFTKPESVRELWIKNGSWRLADGAETYTRNGRVKTLQVEFLYAGAAGYRDTVMAALADIAPNGGWTRLDLGVRDGVVAVRVLILDVYRGSKYKNDVAIAEARLMGLPAGR